MGENKGRPMAMITIPRCVSLLFSFVLHHVSSFFCRERTEASFCIKAAYSCVFKILGFPEPIMYGMYRVRLASDHPAPHIHGTPGPLEGVLIFLLAGAEYSIDRRFSELGPYQMMVHDNNILIACSGLKKEPTILY